MGINYREIESNSVGFKEDYEMHSMDFEEFLWAKGYTDDLIEELYRNMLELKPLSKLQMELLFGLFRDYVTLGGMPEVVNRYIQNGNFSGTLTIQQQLLKDYEEDITKYAEGPDKGKVKANDNATASLNNLLKNDKYPDIKYGIKLGYKNIGFNGKFYTFPYFMTFLLKRFITDRIKDTKI